MASINKKKLADRVIEEIKRMITGGELSAGDKLPNQNEFAAQLGVSRTVLREALHTLAILGVVEQRPKIGTVIVTSAPLIYTEHINAPLMADPNATMELIDARQVIEVGSVELAARHATDEQLQEMGKLIQQMNLLLEAGDTDGYSQVNMAFHLLIAESSGNRFMGHLLATIRGFMERWTLESLSVLPGLFGRSTEAHRQIYRAIIKHDPAAAGEAMRRHLEDFKTSVEDYYRQKSEKGAAAAGK
ncbi:MAG: FadR family transcriptional regulator [Desulfarculaceae bacterium]|nr:FadR family transcriptional regulator [Desulfarculaceae bacterium]MCF8047484.1 FadR family transcriptional regulator [Desulfarculaceae bacterium]MCF8065160.1 FadR family transcriptional regulator [Desulfarculaceae bacterium]MCF8099075.1 FadR family transcriptional regulator [Desulfarculaceae bacterium]MCF8122056.1 FadR family transcriptional regulator [Desulfarculaceae bacterium]